MAFRSWETREILGPGAWESSKFGVEREGMGTPAGGTPQGSPRATVLYNLLRTGVQMILLSPGAQAPWDGGVSSKAFLQIPDLGGTSGPA